MKFAKELERDLVPEWRLAYLNYKLGKKKLKRIHQALRNVKETPRLRRRGVNTFTPSPDEAAPQYAFVNREHDASGDLRAHAITDSRSRQESKLNGSSSLMSDARNGTDQQPLYTVKEQRPGVTRYGSITSERGRAPPSLRLPGAAMDVDQGPSQSGPTVDPPDTVRKAKTVRLAPEVDDGKSKLPLHHASTLPSRYKSVFHPKRINTGTVEHVAEAPRPLLRRVFSMGHHAAPASPGEVPAEAYRELDIRQADFFNFLDMELEKIETFYKQREDEATNRLNVLREQLHIMRDRRLDDLISRQAAKIKAKEKKKMASRESLRSGQHSSLEEERPQPHNNGHLLNHALLSPLDISPLETALEAVKSGKYGKTTSAMADLATPTALAPQMIPESHRDFVRRPDLPDVPYQTARRKLKVALQEYYRGLELLKSYALLNRTAFRKINKKYDKTVNARPTMRYMTEKVNDAWFVKSDVVEGHIRTVEDLYARYFEKGNHKVAVGKLRIKMARAGDFTEHSFRNGLTLAAGFIFGIQGLVYGIQLLNRDVDDDDDLARLHVNTSYLFQIYGGYFLMNLLFLLFCVACRVWHESKINYVFVFEYDTRHHLDWRQLSELPCFYFFLLGLCMWLNFSEFGGASMYHYWPVILLSITALILVLPLPILYFRSRQWLLYSVWRLLLAGLYPVEFRDFYLGDMFCSLTYAMGNIELFFCLYGNEWDHPSRCNSSHSHLIGFFTTLPGIWRALQCLRRYYDTRNVFPHLVNCGKYAATIVFYVTLSVYRINKTESNRAVFLTFAIINSIYTSVWDVIMDWSLGDPYAPHRFLRPTLGYKRVWPYYTAMLIDPILRFNWIPYAVDPLQLQHSAVTSFVVALSEVCRRGMWTLFRVENEHCTNVGRFRASRDVPLPYDIPSAEVSRRESEEEDAEEEQHRHPQVADHEAQGVQHAHRFGERHHHPHPSARSRGSSNLTATTALGTMRPQPLHAATFATSSDLEGQLGRQRTRSSRRRRGDAVDTEAAQDPSPLTRGLSRVGTMLRDAHAQDFERKKKPELGGRSRSEGKGLGRGGTSVRGTVDERDDEEDEEDDDETDEEETGESGRHSTDGEDEDPRTWEQGAEGHGGQGVGEGSRRTEETDGAVR